MTAPFPYTSLLSGYSAGDMGPESTARNIPHGLPEHT